jgi:hypothetical protein
MPLILSVFSTERRIQSSFRPPQQFRTPTAQFRCPQSPLHVTPDTPIRQLLGAPRVGFTRGCFDFFLRAS